MWTKEKRFFFLFVSFPSIPLQCRLIDSSFFDWFFFTFCLSLSLLFAARFPFWGLAFCNAFQIGATFLNIRLFLHFIFALEKTISEEIKSAIKPGAFFLV